MSEKVGKSIASRPVRKKAPAPDASVGSAAAKSPADVQNSAANSPAAKGSAKDAKPVAKKVKGDSLNIGYSDVLDYLIKYSSPARKASVNEMTVYFTALTDEAAKHKKDFHQLTKKQKAEALSAIRPDTKLNINESVRLQLKRVLEAYLDKKLVLGIAIRSSRKEGEVQSSKDACYYASVPFSDSDIVLLRDAISVFPYAEHIKTRKIVEGLNRLTNVRNRIPYSPEVVYADKFRGSYYQNLKEILKAFDTAPADGSVGWMQTKRPQQRIKKVSFTYCRYNHKKELEDMPRSDGSVRRIVDPVKVMWANGYYYLVAFYIDADGKLNYINYRIDRMRDVKCTKEDAEPLSKHLVKREATVYNTKMDGTEGKRLDPKLVEETKRIDDSGFSVGKYKYSHPVMHTGDMLPKVVIRIKDYLMNNAIDTFGFEFPVKKLDNGELDITLYDVSASGVKLWALEYGDSCEVLEPQSLREMLAQSASKLAKQYLTEGQGE